MRVLYFSGRHFACRHCDGLVYATSQQSDSRVYRLVQGGLDAIGKQQGKSPSQLGLVLKAISMQQRRLDRWLERNDRGKSTNRADDQRPAENRASRAENVINSTLAEIEANRRNGQLSTGPRTAEGKATVARDATKHGIFAAVPVIPGECPETWEAHRAGVVESLAPVGLLEVNLAERAALLLWRLQRLARYEAESVAAEMDVVDVPPLPPPEDEDDSPFGHTTVVKQKTRHEHLAELRRELRTARQELAEVIPARDFFQPPADAGSGEAVPFAAAETILEAGCSRAETAENLRADPPAFDSKAFLRKLGLTKTKPENVRWTPELIDRGLAVYAGYTDETPERFRAGVQQHLEDCAEELARKVRRLEAEAAAVTRLLDGRTARKQAAKLLPDGGRDERIAKYERHLHNLLTSTLHELERLQARREGEAVPPPTVADVSVTVDAGTG